MLETELRELFDRQASSEQPPAAITSQQVIRRGRSRRRIRRSGAAAAPLIAAAAATTVVATALPGALPGKPHHHRSVPLAVVAAPSHFDPARLYASFDGLSAGTHVTAAITGTVSQTLRVEDPNAAQPGGLLAWLLTVHAGGQCSTAGRMLRCSGESALTLLSDSALTGPDQSTLTVPLTTQLPDIKSLPVYWAVGPNGGSLVFEYARDGWAVLTGYNPVPVFSDQSEAVRVAQHITFGTSAASPVFAAQLTGLPGWELRSASSLALQGPPQATRIGFASGVAVDAPGPPGPGSAENYPFLTITVAGSVGSCVAAGQPPSFFTTGQSSRTVIAGYAVTITRGQGDVGAGLPTVALQELCAPDADGLAIDIFVYGNRPAIDVTQLFAHLRLLGPDPAKWTTRPVG